MELVVVAAIVWLLFSLRLVALPWFCLAVWFSRRNGAQPVAKTLCWALVLVAILSPWDVRIANLSPSHRGSPQAAVRLVPFVVGMPAHTRLIERHGEYYTGGCSGGCVFPPRSIISLHLGARE